MVPKVGESNDTFEDTKRDTPPLSGQPTEAPTPVVTGDAVVTADAVLAEASRKACI